MIGMPHTLVEVSMRKEFILVNIRRNCVLTCLKKEESWAPVAYTCELLRRQR
jgi:hypothetical protein